MIYVDFVCWCYSCSFGVVVFVGLLSWFWLLVVCYVVCCFVCFCLLLLILVVYICGLVSFSFCFGCFV